MKSNDIGKAVLTPTALDAPISYELCGNAIIGRFLGLIPMQHIELGSVHFLRLAARSEVNPVHLLINWRHFLIRARSRSPIYILQTHKRQRIFLKLDGRAHFKLRQAIGRQTCKEQYRIAA